MGVLIGVAVFIGLVMIISVIFKIMGYDV